MELLFFFNSHLLVHFETFLHWQTDDKGVFATCLSQEYQLVAETFHLTQSQVWDLSYESISYIFASDSTKADLRKKWSHLKPHF